MAIRLTTERIAAWFSALVCVVCAGLLMGLLVTFVGMLSCAMMENRGADSAGLKVQLAQRDAEITGLKLQLEEVKVQVAGTIDESASPTTTAGDNSTITNISLGGSGVMALLLGLLAWRHRTVLGTIDRVVFEIDKEMGASSCPEADQVFKDLKDRIERNGHTGDGGKPDSIQRCLHARLLKLGLARALPRKNGRGVAAALV